MSPINLYFIFYLINKSIVQQPGPENLNIGDRSQLEEDVRKMMDKKYSEFIVIHTLPGVLNLG